MHFQASIAFRKKALLNLAETVDRIIFLKMFALPTFCFTFLFNVVVQAADEGRLVVGGCHVNGMGENQGDMPCLQVTRRLFMLLLHQVL